MDKVLYLAMNGAKHVAWQQATTSNNLANVHTNGFKADLASFRALRVVGDGAPTRTYQVDNTVGHDMSQGSLQLTGNESDFALATPGFFAVQAPGGGEAYTRDGGYIVDTEGVMRTRSGLAIQGEGGQIVVPPGSRITLGIDGTVSAAASVGADRTVQVLGRIKLVNPAERAVYKGDDGLFRQHDGQDAPAAANVQLKSGFLEASNVNAVESLVQMISHSRHYDLNIKLMQTAEQNARQATELLSITG
ncbi:flagellar basal body rod protein FlgF [Vogesella indigofera]|uniref:flagellar basal body rod protein FlgF n=1 Tax=Vogesella indigofera TaxID=45465 RepID=UPI003F43D2E2